MKKESKWIKLYKASPLSARIGLAIIIFGLAVALFAPLLAPYGESEVVADVWLSPGGEHLLGTDQLGRDMLSRIIYGARNSITIAFITTLIAFFVGAFLGLTAAVTGGWLDHLLSRIVDIFMAFPTLILALMILSVLGTSVPVLIVVVALLDATRVFRLARALAMDIAIMEYVDAARLRGEKTLYIVRREILPNALPALIAEFGLRFCFIFLFISSLSFLGLGIQPPTADWGSMVRENSGAINFGILTPLYPAGAIAVLTVSINMVVDWFLHRSAQIRA
ncbi:MAG TPA: ABC transporter permease [Desulfobacteraceae bacterium]|nr:ABC transporter permease [Desulfobacteraceae bacterium]|tara:strand:- start:433 stop:1269 length:837 start_codon:yes stop_codon:yes gene_type:complete